MRTKETLIFERAVFPFISDSDDALFWQTVLDDLEQEFSLLDIDQCKDFDIFLQIGACSHWLRPHQTRLTTAGGFAFPVGYLGSGFSRNGLPEFDWFVLFHWNKSKGEWLESERFFGKRRLVCRVALPTRTLKHNQAVVNVFWSPGTPNQPKQKAKLFYAYRKIMDEWKQVAAGEL